MPPSELDLVVKNKDGRIRSLGKLLGSGGEGLVYPVASDPDVLVKWYHSQYRLSRGVELRDKISGMVDRRTDFEACSVSWPKIMVFDAENQWIGYAMRRGHGAKMGYLAHAKLYQKYFPGLDRRKIVAYLLQLLDAVEQLYIKKVLIGDYNLNNVICNPVNDRITLIDCDSYQIEHEGRRYPCYVGSPDMTPKEQHSLPFAKVVRTPQSESFSLAIILFKCLMLGRHPYDIVGGDDPVENLRKGNFAYGTGNRGIPRGPWFNIWSHMPRRLKAMFITTFTEGSGNPASRPSIAEWREALLVYRKEMDKGWHELSVKPATPKSSEYRGKQKLGTSA